VNIHWTRPTSSARLLGDSIDGAVSKKLRQVVGRDIEYVSTARWALDPVAARSSSGSWFHADHRESFFQHNDDFGCAAPIPEALTERRPHGRYRDRARSPNTRHGIGRARSRPIERTKTRRRSDLTGLSPFVEGGSDLSISSCQRLIGRHFPLRDLRKHV